MDESKLEDLLHTIFFFFIFTNVVGGNTNTNIKTLNDVDAKTPNGEFVNGKITNGKIINGMITDGEIINGVLGFFFQVSRTDISECRALDGGVKTEHFVARTFFSVLSWRACKHI